VAVWAVRAWTIVPVETQAATAGAVGIAARETATRAESADESRESL
jgi:hypothetical protein